MLVSWVSLARNHGGRTGQRVCPAFGVGGICLWAAQTKISKSEGQCFFGFVFFLSRQLEDKLGPGNTWVPGESNILSSALLPFLWGGFPH